jgi:phage/plasmid primase-like uncharacterized protein
MAAHITLVDHASELAELAAACGIDWYQIKDLTAGTHHDLPTIHKKYSKRCTMWVREFTDKGGSQQLSITFHTRKHGGVTRNWYSRSPGGYGGQLPKRNVSREEAERKRRKERFLAYQKGWDSAQKSTGFPYLDTKGIAAILDHFELRQTSDRKVMGSGSLTPFICFPLFNRDGHYVGLQRIYADGAKKLTAAVMEGQYVGAHSIIGNPETSKTIYIGEGFATCASIFLATGSAVVFAYSASNLDPVCAYIRSKYPEHEIIIAADNDWTPKGNTGVFKALEAAQQSRTRGEGLKVIVPPLIGQQKTDFNDIHTCLGLDELRQTLADPANTLRPSRERDQFLLTLLSHAYAQQMPAIVRRLAVLLKVPHLVSEEALRERITQALGIRADQRMIFKAIRSVVIAGKYKAKAIAGIDPGKVELYRQFQTMRNEGGHLVIGEDAVHAVMEEIAKGRTVIVKSPMGSGKTEILIRKAMKAAGRAAHILPRVSVVNDAAGRLQLDHYRDIDKFQAYFTDQMVSCINSMGAKRFMADNGRNWFENLDLLCLDEASQVLPQVATLGNPLRRRANHEALVNSIRTARSILIADADANDFLVSELKRIDPERSITLIDIGHPPAEQKRWRVGVTDSVSFVRKALLDAATDGERCLLATDNRQKAIEIERAIRYLRPEARVLNIHREPSKANLEKIRRFYDNPNTECLNCDVLIYSPAITSGVSITTPHFTKHFGIFTGIIKVNDIMQMLGRDRTAQEWLLALAPRSWAEQRLRASIDLESVGESPTLFSELKYATDRYEIEARENLTVLAMNILKMKGHKVSMLDITSWEGAGAIDMLTMNIAKGMKEERLRRILGQTDISENDYQSLKRHWMPDENEAAAMHAYKIRHVLCADLTEENVAFMDQGGLKKIALFETLLGSDADLNRFDADEKKTLDPSLRYHAAAKKDFLTAVFERLQISLKTFVGEFTHKECQAVVALFTEQAKKANAVFDGIIDPDHPPRCATTFVQKIFRKLGLRIGGRKSNGRMIRFIEPSDLARMLTLRERRHCKGRSLFSSVIKTESEAA